MGEVIRAALAIAFAALTSILLTGCGGASPKPCSAQWISEVNSSMAYLVKHMAASGRQATEIAGEVAGVDMAMICKGGK